MTKGTIVLALFPFTDLTGLKVRSVFKRDKIVTLEKRILRGAIGNVSQPILNELNQRLRMALDL